MANMNTLVMLQQNIRDINIIEERGGLDNIDEKLRVVAEKQNLSIRNIKEIAEVIEDGKLSKSGLNHKKI